MTSASSRELLRSWKPAAGSGSGRDRSSGAQPVLSILLKGRAGNSTFHSPVSHGANSPADGSEVPSDLWVPDNSQYAH